MLRKIKFGLWAVTFVVASISVVWSLVSGGLADAVRLFELEDVAVVVACLVLAGPVGFMALSLERIAGDRESMRARTHPSVQLRGLGSGALWLRWIAAGALGATLTTFVSIAALQGVSEAIYAATGVVVVAGMVAGALLGGISLLGIAVLQLLVVRRLAPWLVLSRGVGGAVGGATVAGVSLVLGSGFGEAAGFTAGLIVGLPAVALAEWLVLRRRVAGTSKLAWVGAAAFAAAGVVGRWIWVVIDASAVAEPGLGWVSLSSCVVGTCHAAVTGFAVPLATDLKVLPQPLHRLGENP